MNCAQVYVVRTTGTPFHVKQALGPYGICRRRGVQNPDQGLLASKESPRKRSYPRHLSTTLSTGLSTASCIQPCSPRRP